MNDHHSVSELTPVLRLGGCYRELIDSLHELGPVLIQARNPGGGLAKLARSVSPILLDGFPQAYDPENNFGFSLDELVAIHANPKGSSDPRDTDSLDFEFGSFTAGLGFLEIAGFSEPGAIRRLADRFGGLPISRDSLESWRKEIQPPVCVCPKCGEAAELRAKHPELSPLFTIFEYASQCGLPMDCRTLGDHVDMTAEMNPDRFHTMGGYLVIHDRGRESILHLNLRFVHAFAINRVRVDDRERATLSIYDMHGNHNFEISSPIPELAGVWRAICESVDPEHSGRGKAG